MILAVPLGRLADRVGRGRVFVAGYVLLLCVYGGAAPARPRRSRSSLYLAAFGAYYAATDGVLMALASALLPEDSGASGLGLLMTVDQPRGWSAAVVFGASGRSGAWR